jgi:hypothetical protein
VKQKRVAIDMSYSERREEVLNASFDYKWIPVDGRGERDYYSISDPKTKKRYNRIYDEPKLYKIPRGNVPVIPFASKSAKTILFGLKAGKGCEWGIYSDIDEDYKHQLTSEYQQINNDGTINYIQGKNRNHLLDCENQIVILAIAYKMYQHNSIIKDTEPDEI